MLPQFPSNEIERLMFVEAARAASSQRDWRLLPIRARVWGRTVLERVIGISDCWRYTGAGTNDGGYGRCEIANKLALTHRLAWEWAYGPVPDGLWVLHRCDNPPCVNPAHLFVGTHSDNMRDRERKGRANHLIGSAHPMHGRLSEKSLTTVAMRDEMRALRMKGMKVDAIAARFGMEHHVVQKVVRRLAPRQAADLPVGEAHHNAVLNAEAVRDMRSRHANGENVNMLAISYGVDRATAKAAIDGKTWRHVTNQQ